MYNQLATYKEAEEIAKQLGTIGGGVVETYIPTYEGPFVPPEAGPAKFLHFRFASGADSFNVGLVRTFMQNSPFTWPSMIIAEVERSRKVPVSVIPVGAPAPTVPTPAPAYNPIDLSHEIRPGQGVFASSGEDKEPLGKQWLIGAVAYEKRTFTSGMMSFVAWQRLPA